MLVLVQLRQLLIVRENVQHMYTDFVFNLIINCIMVPKLQRKLC